MMFPSTISCFSKHHLSLTRPYGIPMAFSYSSASREQARLVIDPKSGIKAKGLGSHKVQVSRE